jgi:peroxiredoxin
METMMSLINTEVKPFKATAYHNGQFVDVSEADLKGKWSVVFFYPADFTFVCPTELGDLADNYAEFQKLGVEIYAVSTDTHFTHKAWHDTSEEIKKIQYPLVGDPTWTLSKNFDVLIESEGLAEVLAFNKSCYDVLRLEKDSAVRDARIRKLCYDYFEMGNSDYPEGKKAAAKQAEIMIQVLLEPWFLHFIFPCLLPSTLACCFPLFA